MTISRNTYDPAKKYRRIQFHQDRDLLDSELNELQDLLEERHLEIAHLIVREGSVLSGLKGILLDHDRDFALVDVEPGTIFMAGQVMQVTGISALHLPTPGRDEAIIWAEALKRTVTAAGDPELVNPATGEPTAERETWSVSLKAEDTAQAPLPPGYTKRLTLPLLYVDKRAEAIMPTVAPRSLLRLTDFTGTLPAESLRPGTLREDSLSFEAAEGLRTLHENIARRTYDAAGSYVVDGLDSFIAANDGELIDVVTNTGQAYVRGYRFELSLPRITKVPKATTSRLHAGEQKTFQAAKRRYPVADGPLKESTQLTAIVEATAEITRGSVAGGQDLLNPGPVVQILEVKQGATVYQQGVDWQQSGNTIDWLPGGNEPTIGTSYSARWTHSRLMVRNQDYVDGGWFGRAGSPASGEQMYFVSSYKTYWDAVDGDPDLYELFDPEREVYDVVDPFSGITFSMSRAASGLWTEVPEDYRMEELRPILFECDFEEEFIMAGEVGPGGLHKLRWDPVYGADGYRVYRLVNPANPTSRLSYKLLRDVGNCYEYTDDGADPLFDINPVWVGVTPVHGHPVDPYSAAIPEQPTVTIEGVNPSLINFGTATHGKSPVPGTNFSVNFLIYLSRRDLLCLSGKDILRIEGAPSEHPKLPPLPEGTMPLCSIECPPNSVEITLTNLKQQRITMPRIHQLIEEVEQLKYNDARMRHFNQLLHRENLSKKGIYSDNFANDSQCDRAFPEWSARHDPLREEITVERAVRPEALDMDGNTSSITHANALALLPSSEILLFEQTDWSELRVINPTARFGRPKASLHVESLFARKGGKPVVVSGESFQPNITNLQLRCDGLLVAGNIATDSFGRFTRTFLLTSQHRTGSRILEATDGVSTARSLLHIHEPSRIHRVHTQVLGEKGVVHTHRESIASDFWRIHRSPDGVAPLAQSFQFQDDGVVSAIGVYFGGKDPQLPITIQLRGVTAGVPNDQVLAHRTLSPADVVLGGETKIVFDHPIPLEGGAEYAAVFLTESQSYSLRAAVLGEAGQDGLIAALINEQGNLFESPDGSGWSQIDNAELAIKLYGREFSTEGEARFFLPPGTSFSTINLDEFSVQPIGTAIRWQYSHDGGASWRSFVPGEEETLDGIEEELLLRARFSTNNPKVSPALNLRDIQWLGYANNPSSSFVTHELKLSQGVYQARLYAEMYVPSGTSVSWFGSTDNGTTWEPMVLTGTQPLDEVWTEFTFERVFTQTWRRDFRFKAVLTTSGHEAPRLNLLGISFL